MLDVTDPENPAYCFQGQSYDVCERFPEYRDAPLDAHRYLSLYYNLTEGQPLEYDDEDGVTWFRTVSLMVSLGA